MRGEIASLRGETGGYDHRARLLQRSRCPLYTFQVVELAVVVERLVGLIDPHQDVIPFPSALVGPVKLANTEHSELGLIVATHDVERGPSVADVVQRRQRLGGKNRRHDRRLHRRAQHDIAGQCGESRNVGKRFEAVKTNIVLTAITFPTG